MAAQKITIVLNETEAEALVRTAQSDLRQPREQARFLLRCELARRGLLSPELPTMEAAPSHPRATTAAL